MGGEFYCNPHWYEILDMFLNIGCHIRLVSNGDWGNDDKIKKLLSQLNNNYPNNFHISLSYDSYHTNQFTDNAIDFLNNNNFKYNVGETSNVGEDGLIPIGRSECSFGFYGLYGCYCDNPERQYSFLIDEIGKIYKCSFGVWSYATIQDYENGNFTKCFKEFNKKFYSCFITSCSSCIRIARQKARKERRRIIKEEEQVKIAEERAKLKKQKEVALVKIAVEKAVKVKQKILMKRAQEKRQEELRVARANAELEAQKKAKIRAEKQRKLAEQERIKQEYLAKEAAIKAEREAARNEIFKAEQAKIQEEIKKQQELARAALKRAEEEKKKQELIKKQ